MSPDLDLVFMYVDLGDPWWKTGVTEMLRSARRQMPNAHIVQMSDATARKHPFADALFQTDMECTADNFLEFRAHALTSYMKRAERPVIYSGGDVIWCEPHMACGAYKLTPYGAAVHFKADRDAMIRFARSLDGGEPFKQLLPDFDEIARQDHA
jgi:hypothetical protein